ncbi:RNA polymerase sigma factor [Streptomyces virginiae]|uniref:RNA polymerase sigma factor n=1 Tax=Streptomyces virginiae TaxID=1961 RepID=UPI0036CF2CB6
MVDRNAIEDDIADMYRAKGRVLVRHARRRLKEAGIPASRVGAEDIVQDAIVITLVNDQKKHIDNLGAYAYEVVGNLVRDEAKRRGVTTPFDATEPGTTARKVLWVSPVEDDVAGRLDAENVLRKMSPQQRRLILLAKGIGYSHEELAQSTQLHRGTIGQHIARATKALISGMAAVIVAISIFSTHGGSGDPTGPGSRIKDFLRYIASPSLEEIVYVGVLLALGVIALIIWASGSPAQRRAARHSMVLAALLNNEKGIREKLGKDFPTPEEYARELRIKPQWITLEALQKADAFHALERVADEHPLHLLLTPEIEIAAIRLVKNGENVILRSDRGGFSSA